MVLLLLLLLLLLNEANLDVVTVVAVAAAEDAVAISMYRRPPRGENMRKTKRCPGRAYL
jgi:hypothetical protein